MAAANDWWVVYAPHRRMIHVIGKQSQPNEHKEKHVFYVLFLGVHFFIIFHLISDHFQSDLIWMERISLSIPLINRCYRSRIEKLIVRKNGKGECRVDNKHVLWSTIEPHVAQRHPEVKRAVINKKKLQSYHNVLSTYIAERRWNICSVHFLSGITQNQHWEPFLKSVSIDTDRSYGTSAVSYSEWIEYQECRHSPKWARTDDD